MVLQARFPSYDLGVLNDGMSINVRAEVAIYTWAKTQKHETILNYVAWYPKPALGMISGSIASLKPLHCFLWEPVS